MPGTGAVHRDQARQLVRNLQAGEELLAADGVAHHHGQVQGQPGDVGERVGRIHRQRGEDREHLGGEPAVEALPGVLVEFAPAGDGDVLGREGRAHLLGEDLGVPALELVGGLQDVVQLVQRADPGGGGNGQSGGDAALQAGHAHHEELVQVGREDGQEAHPLQQEQVRVLRQFQHARIEVQPADLAVQETVQGEVAFGTERRLEVGEFDAVLRGAGGGDIAVAEGLWRPGSPWLSSFRWGGAAVPARRTAAQVARESLYLRAVGLTARPACAYMVSTSHRVKPRLL